MACSNVPSPFSGHDVANTSLMVIIITCHLTKCLVVQSNMLRCTPVCSYCMIIPQLVLLFLYFRYMLTELINSMHITHKPTFINSVCNKTISNEENTAERQIPYIFLKLCCLDNTLHVTHFLK
jgi:amino acid permease